MSTPENTIAFAIGCMDRAKKAIDNLVEDILVGDGMDGLDLHKLRVALESIAEDLMCGGLQCQSDLNDINRACFCGDQTPSDVTIPSPALSKLLRCNEQLEDGPEWEPELSTPSTDGDGIHGYDFGDSDTGFPFYQASDNSDD
jgi:hypothetical protein